MYFASSKDEKRIREINNNILDMAGKPCDDYEAYLKELNDLRAERDLLLNKRRKIYGGVGHERDNNLEFLGTKKVL